MPDDYKIHLNFLPIIGTIPPFKVFRKLRGPQDTRPNESVSAYSLPSTTHLEERNYYWVQSDPHPDFHDFLVHPNYNNDLTCWALFKAICDSAQRRRRPQKS